MVVDLILYEFSVRQAEAACLIFLVRKKRSAFNP